MSGLNNVPTKRVMRAFKKAGWYIEIEGANHTLLRNPERPDVPLPIPRHKTIKQTVLRKMIKDTGLSVDEFLRLI